MSIIEEDLLAPTITKRRVIKVIIVSVLLLSLFGFSTYIYALILGTQRREPSQRLEDADSETPIKVLIEPPFDIEDLIEEMDLDLEELAEELDLTPQQLEELLGDTIEEMYDGSIDDLDLAAFGIAIIALLFSEVEVFRVYDYDNPVDERQNILWKYECFDEFTGAGWHNSMPQEPNNFFSYDDYNDNYYFLDNISLKRPLSPNIGQNSFVLGTLFRSEDGETPFLIKESIKAPNLDEDEIFLYKDNLGGTTATLTFSSDNNVNMTYGLFSEILPTNEEINNSAVNAISTPQSILDHYIQLPPSLSEYLAINDDFRFHYELLDSIIDQNNDNAFVIANKIRNYLQSNFEVNFEELLNDGPVEGEDVVEWFCEKRQGLWSEFASAFCAFSRAFGIASRFVDGFNSRNTTQFFDPVEARNTYAIKYRNIYNWAEIYVPTSTSGAGYWVQMDILFDSFGEGGNPLTDFNLTIESEFQTYDRYNTANITAILSSNTQTLNNRQINFEDITIDQSLLSATTDEYGRASILIYIDNTQVAGPHVIRGYYGLVENYTYYVVDENVWVDFISATPQEINVSQSPARSWVEGYVRDTLTNDGVPNAMINFVLLQKGTNNRLSNPFINDYGYTDENGYFNMWLYFREQIPYGEYDLRVDFNGTWILPVSPYIITLSYINDSSITININITKQITYDLLLSIDGRPTEYPADPNQATLITAKRGQSLNLSVTVFDSENNSVVSGQNVDFYDYTNGNIFIGSDLSDSNGKASILYTPNTMKKAGPNLIYAQIGAARNYSYFILNESIHINLISGPTLPIINIITGGSDPFNIQGNITDEVGNPIGYAEIRLKLFRDGYDYSGYLIPTQSYPYIVGPDGNFNLIFQVDETTPIGNYSLRLDFNGTFRFYNDINNRYQFNFNLPSFSNASLFQNELKVFDPNNIIIYLSVENYPTRIVYDDLNRPVRYKSGEIANFQVTIYQSGGSPELGRWVRIYDVYDGNRELDAFQFNGINNYVEFNISIDSFNFAGIHRINVRFDMYFAINSTFIIINKSVSFSPNPPTISSNIIQRSDGGFTINGYVRESGVGMRGLWVRVLLFNKNNINVSQFLIGGNPYALTNSIGFFSIYINSIDINCLQGSYRIRIDFNGSIEITEVPGIDLIPNYMINISSNYLNLNITAGTFLSDSYYYKVGNDDKWREGSPLYVYGNLSWDNNSLIQGIHINVTIRDGDGTILDSEIDSDLTDINGFFNVSFIVGQWLEDTEVWVYFKPQDNFSFPEYFYITPIQQSLSREP